MAEVTHQCPPADLDLTPCCIRPVLALPHGHRITLDPDEVTCVGDGAVRLAQRFHEAYERLAPGHGYKTREASAVPWAEVPDQNKRLMVAVCCELLGERRQ